MKFEELSLPGVILIKPTIFKDNRGTFMESYHVEKFTSAGISCTFKQDNHVRSENNTLRGLHFQTKNPQSKLIGCVSGEIYDVAVDIRKDSSYYGKWIGQKLSAANHYQLFVPKGFAHGYYVLSDRADVLYKCSDIYYPEDERGVIWNDPGLCISWPCDSPILSDKDSMWPLIK